MSRTSLDDSMNMTYAPPASTQTTPEAEVNPDSLGRDFATEVKMDRLDALWRGVLVVSGLVFLFSFVFTLSGNRFEPLWSISPLVLMISSVLTGTLIKRNRFDQAAWMFSLGAVVALSAAMYTQSPIYYEIMPYGFVVVVFVIGLLIHPLNTFVLALISGASVVLIPYLATGGFEFFGGVQVFALVLILISAALAAQVTGELYAITEWALMNYKRERRTNSDLFESRIALERSLKRSEALGERLALMNAELENARAAAETAKNFRGQFLANMSHELRTPLNAIIGFSETMRRFPMMYDDVPLPDAYAHDLDQIYNSGKQLLTLINDILDLAKIDAGKLDVRVSDIEVDQIVTSVMSTANGLIGEKPITLCRDFELPLPRVQADPNRFRQVLLNLYSNAVKFSDAGDITLKIRETDDGVLFSLNDNGVGIPPENLELIFEEFKQGANHGGRDPRAGSGLGLAISRQLLTLMNGRIWVESELNKGSTFHFIIQKATPEKPEGVVESNQPVTSVESAESAAQEIES